MLFRRLFSFSAVFNLCCTGVHCFDCYTAVKFRKRTKRQGIHFACIQLISSNFPLVLSASFRLKNRQEKKILKFFFFVILVITFSLYFQPIIKITGHSPNNTPRTKKNFSHTLNISNISYLRGTRLVNNRGLAYT